MDQDKRLQIYEDHKVLEITLSWYTPIAWGLAFFSLIWCGFLAFFYSGMIAGGAPLFAFLFPLIHVAVGLIMAYNALCMFFNKTYLDIADNQLTVHHEPIPWWRGNLSFATQDIEQLYIKETVKKGKNGTTRTYKLRAKLVGGKDKAVLDMGTVSKERLKIIEQKLEQFMGIEDRPVSGEYNVINKARVPLGSIRRQIRRDFVDTQFLSLYTNKEGGRIQISNQDFNISSIVQYDWEDGNSDKQLQLFDSSNSEKLIYVLQNRGVLNAYQEQELRLAATASIGFQSYSPPTSFHHEGLDYILINQKRGKKFVTEVKGPLLVQQWLYETADASTYIRVIGDKGAFTFFKGNLLDKEDFDQPLDLNDQQIRETEIRNNRWDEEDFV